ncbi:MAG: CPBP family intramembrane metalloprotease [Oligoflexia bacterium]|nr:CPBP family intramembrane metalloprotease [Oligoflexia bacterium]
MMISLLAALITIGTFLPTRSFIHLGIIALVNFLFIVLTLKKPSLSKVRTLLFFNVLFLIIKTTFLFLDYDYFSTILPSLILLIIFYKALTKEKISSFFKFSNPLSFTFILYTVVSAAGLIFWYKIANPTLPMEMDLKSASILKIITIGAMFSLINSFYEEIIFRGIYLKFLSNATSSTFIAITVQAIIFGLIHFLNGVPSGFIGVLLTFFYALMMGHLYLKTKSLVPCIIAHLLCDGVVYGLIVFNNLGKI